MSENFNEKLPKDIKTSFYLDNPKKIFILSMLSCGFYYPLWFYRHWRHFKRRAIAMNKNNQLNLDIYEKDKDIKPFWSAFFSGFYIVGTARRIRDKMKSRGLSNYATGPWWAWYFFSINTSANRYEPSADINLNVIFYLLDIFLMAIATWQITRLQIKANMYMTLSNECESFVGINFNKWDIGVTVFGFIVGIFVLFGSIYFS